MATLANHHVRRRHGEHRLPASGPASGWATPRRVYLPRRPTQTPLYPVVQHHLETFLAQAAEADTLGEGVPTWVERDFRGYLECGILAYGFARARCEECGHERLIPFSCKGRGVCPSCSARRMCEVAAHLTDHVLPQLPVRQWVLSVPKRLRPYLQRDTRVAGAVLRIFLRAVRTALRHASPGAPAGAQLGAVSFFHRFGSSLNVHPHFHVVVLDGVFSRSGASDCDARFYEASDLTPAHVHQLESTVQRRVLRLFARRGLLDEADTDDMLTWQGSGGFSVDASVRIEGEDRAGIERLVRYCARPPFALERLHTLEGSASSTSPESRLLYRSPKPDVHGRTDIVLTPLELLQRLARFIPPGHPRAAWVACIATVTTASSRRTRRCEPKSSRSVGPISGPSPPSPKPRSSHPARPPNESPEPQAEVVSPGPTPEPGPPPASPARIRWAVLLARIYEVLPLLCPACGGEMRILAFLTDPPVVSAILLHLDLPHRPPPLAPARAPPQIDFLTDPSDQTPAFDPAEPEPVPEFEFDQSVPDDFGLDYDLEA